MPTFEPTNREEVIVRLTLEEASRLWRGGCLFVVAGERDSLRDAIGGTMEEAQRDHTPASFFAEKGAARAKA